MGRTPSEKPARLAEKLTYIRKALDLSQDGIVRRLGLEQKLTREDISKYERGLRLPSLLTLLMYARAAGVSVDLLIDDELDLPMRLPGTVNHTGADSRFKSKSQHPKRSRK